LNTISSERPSVRVFKFGGASVKDAAGFRNVAAILLSQTVQAGKIVVVVSAMGKTTNALEKVVEEGCAGLSTEKSVAAIIEAHKTQAALAIPGNQDVLAKLDELGTVLAKQAQLIHTLPFDEAYDQIVCLGELLSSQILAQVIGATGIKVALLDARRLIKTDSNFRAPLVEQPLTRTLIQEALTASQAQVFVVQGFIGSDELGRTTTLGREGSDYTAALFGQALQAQSVTVWKDVPGVLNADPKRLPTASLIKHLTYADAAEMTYYGATVIHPKTLKPLANLGIPLYVRSFVTPEVEGTTIGSGQENALATNVLLHLDKVALITCQTRDLQFVTELHVSKVMRTAHDVGLQVLLVQNSALEMQLVVPQDFQRAARVTELLLKDYAVETTYSLALVTFLRAQSSFIDEYLTQKLIILTQKTDTSFRVLIRA